MSTIPKANDHSSADDGSKFLPALVDGSFPKTNKVGVLPEDPIKGDSDQDKSVHDNSEVELIKRPADHEEEKALTPTDEDATKEKDAEPHKPKDDGTAPDSAASNGPLADTTEKQPEAQNECSEKPWLSELAPKNSKMYEKRRHKLIYSEDEYEFAYGAEPLRYIVHSPVSNLASKVWQRFSFSICPEFDPILP